MVNGLSEILVQLPLSQVTELVVSLLLVATLTTFHVSVSPPTSTTWVMIGYCVSGRERGRGSSTSFERCYSTCCNDNTFNACAHCTRKLRIPRRLTHLGSPSSRSTCGGLAGINILPAVCMGDRCRLVNEYVANSLVLERVRERLPTVYGKG